MGRTITAGASQTALPTNQGDTTDEAMNDQLRQEIEALWEAIRPKVRQLGRLRARLADPALATHSRRSEAEAAFQRLEAEVDAAMKTIGQHWNLLSEATCKAMARDGWPDAKGGVEFAVTLLGDIALGEPYQLGVNREWAA